MAETGFHKSDFSILSDKWKHMILEFKIVPFGLTSNFCEPQCFSMAFILFCPTRPLLTN